MYPPLAGALTARFVRANGLEKVTGQGMTAQEVSLKVRNAIADRARSSGGATNQGGN